MSRAALQLVPTAPPAPRSFSAFMSETVGRAWYLAPRRSNHPRFAAAQCVTPKAYAKFKAAHMAETADRIGTDPTAVLAALVAASLKWTASGGETAWTYAGDGGEWVAIERVLRAAGLPVAYLQDHSTTKEG